MLDIQLAKCHSNQIIIETATQKICLLELIDTNNNRNFDYDLFYVTKTSIKYCFMLEQQRSNKNININFEWLTQSRMKKPITEEMIYAILKHFGDDVFSKKS